MTYHFFEQGFWYVKGYGVGLLSLNWLACFEKILRISYIINEQAPYPGQR
jgi:hypothetical protein